MCLFLFLLTAIFGKQFVMEDNKVLYFVQLADTFGQGPYERNIHKVPVSLDSSVFPILKCCAM